MVTYDGLNGNVEYENMIGNDDVYRMLVKKYSRLDNLEMPNTDRYITIDYDGRKLSVNRLTWLQLMGLMETWDIL